MIREYGDMWSAWDQADLFLICASSSVRVDGCLIMHEGASVEARRRFAGVERALGKAIANARVKWEKPSYTVHWPYGLLVSERWPDAKLGLFQDRLGYRDAGDLFTIHESVEKLGEWVFKHNCEVHLELPFSLLLDTNEVLRHMEQYLDDHVHVWQSTIMRPKEIT